MGLFLRGISQFTFVVHVARSGIRRRNEEAINTRAVNQQKWGKNVCDKSFEYRQNLDSVTVSVLVICICSTFFENKGNFVQQLSFLLLCRAQDAWGCLTTVHYPSLNTPSLDFKEHIFLWSDEQNTYVGMDVY